MHRKNVIHELLIQIQKPAVDIMTKKIEGTMTNSQKAELITPWINPEERITVDFTDVQGLNAQVSGCTKNVVHLIFADTFPHMKDRVTIPLRYIEVGKDKYHYTRDPKSPLQSRLRLRIEQKRPDGL